MILVQQAQHGWTDVDPLLRTVRQKCGEIPEIFGHARLLIIDLDAQRPEEVCVFPRGAWVFWLVSSINAITKTYQDYLLPLRTPSAILGQLLRAAEPHSG